MAASDAEYWTEASATSNNVRIEKNAVRTFKTNVRASSSKSRGFRFRLCLLVYYVELLTPITSVYTRPGLPLGPGT